VDAHVDAPALIETAEAEMRALIDLAHQHQRAHIAARNRVLMLIRFGVGEVAPASLAEAAMRFGVSRERVRQLEAKMLLRLSSRRAELHAPALARAAAIAAARDGAPDDALEADLAHLLGAVQLREALRFWRAIRAAAPEAPPAGLRVIAGGPAATVMGATAPVQMIVS